jgi:hypothetical protein
MVIITTRCLSSGINSVNTLFDFSFLVSERELRRRNPFEPSATANAVARASGYNPARI